MALHLWVEASRGVPSLATVQFNTAVDGVDAVMSLGYGLSRRDTGKGPWIVTGFAGIITSQWVRLEQQVSAYHLANPAA
jgi:hypothetical protein